MNKIRIIEAGNELSLGGTEHVMQLYSKYLNKDYFDVKVVSIHWGGARVKLIEDMGIPVVILNGNIELLADLLQKTDVFHWHCNGWMDELVFKIIKENRPKLVLHTNVFGEHDHSRFYDLIDYDLYVSSMILIRRIHEDSNNSKDTAPDLFISKRKVLANPVDVDHIISLLPSDEEVKNFKLLHKLTNSFIVGRIGRSDNYKFDLITLDGFAEFYKKVDNAMFLLVGATPEILAYASQIGIADQLIVFETTIELERLLVYYKSLDVFLAVSNIGESFGMVIAEAMTVGVPVITVSTEAIDTDNAQIEMVDNNKNGLVVERNASTIGNAILHLYQDESTRKRLSDSSSHKIIEEYKADKIVASLESLIFDYFNLAVPGYNKTLIKEYSEEMVDQYNYRLTDLWRKT